MTTNNEQTRNEIVAFFKEQYGLPMIKDWDDLVENYINEFQSFIFKLHEFYDDVDKAKKRHDSY